MLEAQHGCPRVPIVPSLAFVSPNIFGNNTPLTMSIEWPRRSLRQQLHCCIVDLTKLTYDKLIRRPLATVTLVSQMLFCRKSLLSVTVLEYTPITSMLGQDLFVKLEIERAIMIAVVIACKVLSHSGLKLAQARASVAFAAAFTLVRQTRRA